MLKKTIAALVLTTTLATPAAYAGDNMLGTLLGAAGGAAVGSNIGKGKGNIAAIALGTLLGAGLGSSIGSNNHGYARPQPVYSSTTTYRTFGYDGDPRFDNYYFDDEDNNYGRSHNRGHRKYHHRNHHRPVTYNHTSYVVPDYHRQNRRDDYCREYTQTVKIGGQIQSSYGHACLQPDGSWKIRD